MKCQTADFCGQLPLLIFLTFSSCLSLYLAHRLLTVSWCMELFSHCMLNYANTLPADVISLETPWNLIASLVRNISKTGDFCIGYTLHVFLVLSVRSRVCIELIGRCGTEIDQWMSVWFVQILWMHLNLSSTICALFLKKSCLTFELE